MFDPVHTRVEGVVFTPLLQDIYWVEEMAVESVPLHWEKLMCSRALVPGRAVDLCLCCLNQHLCNSATCEAVWPNHAVHEFWTLWTITVKCKWREIKIRRGIKQKQQKQLTWGMLEGAWSCLLQNFEWKTKSSVSNLSKENLFLLSKGIFTLEIILDAFELDVYRQKVETELEYLQTMFEHFDWLAEKE